MAIAYRIRDWTQHFENNRTRDLKFLTWIPIPNKHDGDGYTELLDHPEGVEHFGVWILLLQVASKCDPRGTLMRDTAKPHDFASISRMTRARTDTIAAAVSRLIDIGWIELYDIDLQEVVSMSHEGAGISQDDATEPQQGVAFRNGMEGNGRERNGREEDSSEPSKATASEPAILTFPVVGEKGKTWTLYDSKLAEYIEAYPGVDVMQELRQALQWCRDNSLKRKTARGMTGFLSRWLATAQNRASGSFSRAPPSDQDPRGNFAAARRYMEKYGDEQGPQTSGD